MIPEILFLLYIGLLIYIGISFTRRRSLLVDFALGLFARLDFRKLIAVGLLFELAGIALLLVVPMFGYGAIAKISGMFREPQEVWWGVWLSNMEQAKAEGSFIEPPFVYEYLLFAAIFILPGLSLLLLSYESSLRISFGHRWNYVNILLKTLAAIFLLISLPFLMLFSSRVLVGALAGLALILERSYNKVGGFLLFVGLVIQLTVFRNRTKIRILQDIKFPHIFLLATLLTIVLLLFFLFSYLGLGPPRARMVVTEEQMAVEEPKKEFEISCYNVTTGSNIDSYTYMICGDISGPISAIVERNIFAGDSADIGDIVVFTKGGGSFLKNKSADVELLDVWHRDVWQGKVISKNESIFIIENLADKQEVRVSKNKILWIIGKAEYEINIERNFSSEKEAEALRVAENFDYSRIFKVERFSFDLFANFIDAAVIKHYTDSFYYLKNRGEIHIVEFNYAANVNSGDYEISISNFSDKIGMEFALYNGTSYNIVKSFDFDLSDGFLIEMSLEYSDMWARLGAYYVSVDQIVVLDENLRPILIGIRSSGNVS